MTDDERIAKLTELAKKVWPDAEAYKHDGMIDVGFMRGVIYLLQIRIWHPRAADALEAALLVLSGEGKALTREVFHEAVHEAATRIAESRRESMAELEEALVPAWAEELAKQWETRVCGIDDGYDTALNECIAELRERARGEP